MYPNELKKQSEVSYRESIDRIQRAVNAYQEEKQILPILNASQDTPRYEKFRINLNLLQKSGFIDEIPVTAFENGGSAYFLILNEETDPTVKVMDLLTVQQVNDVQRLVSKYYNSKSVLPSDGEIYPGLFKVDLAAISGQKYALNSPFSNTEIPFIMDSEGNVYVDYAMDIMMAIDKSEREPVDGEDIRSFLEDHSYFVPVKSLSYAWINNEPVAQLK